MKLNKTDLLVWLSGRALTHAPGGQQFNSWSGHRPRMQAPFPAGGSIKKAADIC